MNLLPCLLNPNLSFDAGKVSQYFQILFPVMFWQNAAEPHIRRELKIAF